MPTFHLQVSWNNCEQPLVNTPLPLHRTMIKLMIYDFSNTAIMMDEKDEINFVFHYIKKNAIWIASLDTENFEMCCWESDIVLKNKPLNQQFPKYFNPYKTDTKKEQINIQFYYI